MALAEDKLKQLMPDVDLDDKLQSSHYDAELEGAQDSFSHSAMRSKGKVVRHGAFANARWLVVGLVICVLAAIASQYLALKRTQTLAHQMALTTKMIVSAEQIGHEVNQVLTLRDPRAFGRVRLIAERFDQSLGELATTGSGVPGIQQPFWFFEGIETAKFKWEASRAGLLAIVSGKTMLPPIWHELEKLGDNTERLSKSAQALRANLLKNSTSLEIVHLAGEQQILAERMARDLTRFANADRQSQENLGLVKDNAKAFDAVYLKLRATAPDSAQLVLDELESSWRTLRDSIGIISRAADTFINVTNAGVVVNEGSFQLVQALDSLLGRIQGDRRFGWLGWLPWLLALASVILLCLIARQLVVDARRRLAESEKTNKETQDSIMRLLDELGNVADGDLTVQAEIGDRMTGAIADAVNYAIREMRVMVRRIRDAATQVGTETEQTRERAEHLASASAQQAQQITDACAKVDTMATAMHVMATKAGESVEAANGSKEVAKRGAEAVNRSISSLNAIRERTQQTSKRIKRLGESSQQISEIVAIIEDVADKTNMLSMNASIQADAAGESGRAFAAVAEEVQALAEKSTNATAEIAELVKTIQADTNDAVASMESATAEVVEGTQVADEAGKALGEIESVSDDLAQLIERISVAAKKHSDSATSVSSDMTDIGKITQRATTSVRETTGSVGRLTELARELTSSVKGFRLPD